MLRLGDFLSRRGDPLQLATFVGGNMVYKDPSFTF